MIRPLFATVIALTASTPLPAANQATPIKSAPTSKGKAMDPDAVRCIKTPVIGSLAQMQRTCMTNREWDRTRNDIQRLRGAGTCPSGQCSGGG